MMLIPYEASNFPATFPNAKTGNYQLNASWNDIVWSAITAGKPGFSYLLAHKWHSQADLVVRSHTVYANLLQDGKYITKSTLYNSLDPTEKAATSYFLGMTMAKLFAAKLLDTPWLFHVSQASKGAKISFKKGSKSQPDLIGLNNSNQWIIIEAKGRTNNFDQVAHDKAKSQTEMIRFINGVAPYLRVALQAYFNEYLTVNIDDPIDDASSVDISMDVDSALCRYYAMVLEITTKNSKVELIKNQEYLTYLNTESGITIGVEPILLESLSARKFEEVRAYLNLLSRETIKIDDNSAIYPDGIYVRLDSRWSSQNMSIGPEMRGG